MKPPVEHVKVSAKGRDILIKLKRNTGLEHWNEICRIALCRSLANPTPPLRRPKVGDSNIDMEWKTFAGAYQEVYITLIMLRAQKDKVDYSDRNALSEYFRDHLERGITDMKNEKGLLDLI